MGDSPDPNFQFFSYNWSNANEVLQLRMKDTSHISVWDPTDFNDGTNQIISLTMYKSG